MVEQFDRKLIPRNRRKYYGHGFGAAEQRVCEIVFNTSMVGYQESSRSVLPIRRS